METPIEVHNALLRLIRNYLDRQQVVVRAMIHYRPDLILAFGIDKILNIDVEPQYAYFVENYLGNDGIFTGVWEAEWKYRLHGHGCRLTHMETGEPLEWDVGHPKSFNMWWFGAHLEWRIEHDPTDADIKTYGKWKQQTGSDLFHLVDELIRNGSLEKVPQNNTLILKSK